MNSEQFDLFLILLKLKSYLVSLIDVQGGTDSMDYTEEFLDRKYPERKEEVLDLLHSFDINSDAEIVFDERIHYKFKEMVRGKKVAYDISSILEKFHIESIEETYKDKTIEEIKLAREQKLKEIVSILLQLARIWTQRNEIENAIENYSFLEEEELIRPEEEKQLGKLGEDTSVSFKVISKITHLYLEQLVEYYFKFGGDTALAGFIKGLDEFKKLAQSKYHDLFKQSGLDLKTDR